MKKFLFACLTAALFSGCTLFGSQITFTTPNASVVDPAVDSLDLAISQPMMAYISGVQCDGQDAIEVLPVVTEEMHSQTAHNLSLNILADQPAGSFCELTVTAYNQTTTANFSDSIYLYVLEKPVLEEEPAPEATEGAVEEPESSPADKTEEELIEAVPTEGSVTVIELPEEEKTDEEACLADGGRFVVEQDYQCDGEGEDESCITFLVESCEFDE